MNNPYGVLGVAREATDDEIRRAYERRLADAAGAVDLARVLRLSAAYDVLRDPTKRRMYDHDGQVSQVPRLSPDDRYFATRAVPFRQWEAAPVVEVPAARPRRKKSRGALSTLLVAALSIAGVSVAWQHGSLRNAAGQVLTGDIWHPQATVTGGPPLHHVAHPLRLLPPVPSTPGGQPFAFELARTGAPPRFDPCRPVRYVVSGNEPFPGASAMLTQAVNDVSAATGLKFVYEGTTTETPSAQRAPYQPDRYGEQWAPVLVAWTAPEVVPKLAGRVVGVGGGSVASLDGKARVVSGIVYLDAPDLARMMSRPQGPLSVRSVILHELGHLVGLAHVDDPSQVMYPSAGPLAGYGAGDREGLAALGRGECFTDW